MLTFRIDIWNEEIQPKMLKAGFTNPPGKAFVFIKGKWADTFQSINIVFKKPSDETFFMLKFL